MSHAAVQPRFDISQPHGDAAPFNPALARQQMDAVRLLKAYVQGCGTAKVRNAAIDMLEAARSVRVEAIDRFMAHDRRRWGEGPAGRQRRLRAALELFEAELV